MVGADAEGIRDYTLLGNNSNQFTLGDFSLPSSSRVQQKHLKIYKEDEINQ